MKYRIVRSKKSGPKWMIKQLEDRLKIQASKLDRYFKNYPKPVQLDAHISDRGKEFQLAYSINLKNGIVVYTGDKGGDLGVLANKVYNSFVKTLKRQLAKERREHLRHRWKQQASNVAAYFEQLGALQKDESSDAFVHLVQKIMPEVSDYLLRRLQVAHHSDSIPKNEVDPVEMANELYLRVYSRFDEGRLWGDQFHLWVYRIAEELLKENMEKYKQEADLPTISIEELQRKERANMEERFTADADGDLVMEEELDDISYHLDQHKSYNYNINDLHLSDEEEEKLIESIELDKEDYAVSPEFSHEIKNLLSKMPQSERSIFNLYTQEQLTLEEIAKIKRMKVDKVEEVIQRVREALQKSFENINADGY